MARKPVPATLDNELSAIDEELARQDKVLAQRRAEIAAINAKYESRQVALARNQVRSGSPQVPRPPNTPPTPAAKGSTSSVTK